MKRNLHFIFGSDTTSPELGRLMHASGLIQRAKLKCEKGASMEVLRLNQAWVSVIDHKIFKPAFVYFAWEIIHFPADNSKP